jgi:hypothetical protein
MFFHHRLWCFLRLLPRHFCCLIFPLNAQPYSPDSYNDPTSWIELRQLLATARSELGAAGFVPPTMSAKAIRESSADGRRQLLEAAYRPHEQAVFQAILQRLDADSWPHLNPVQSHYAAIILRYAPMFVAHICLETETKNYSTIFPFPDIPVNEVALYLCTRWWHDVGWMDFARDFTLAREPLV